MKKIFLFCLPFLYCLILLLQQDKSFTQDLGRHIKVGEIIWQTHTVPNVNLFSYTQPGQPFINHHWLSEVVFYLSYTFLGVNSLIFLKIILVLSSFGLVYFIAFKKAQVFAFCASFFYIYIFSYRFDVRPELFSFLFISLFVFLIVKYQENKNLKYLLFLPLIELVWVNMHIYFILGIILYSCFLLGEFLKSKAIEPKLLGVFAALLASALINPLGIVGALEPLRILQNYGYSIVENQSVFFLNQFYFNPYIAMFEIAAFLLFIVSIISIRRLNSFLLIGSAAATFLSFKMVRNFPIFVLVSFPLFVQATALFVEKIKDKQYRTFLLASIFLIAVLFAVVTSVGQVASPVFGLGYIKGAERGVDYFKEKNLQGPIFNNFDIGSYLIFRLYPEEKVFVDGRPEAYSVKFFDDYKKMQTDPKFFDVQVRRYGIMTIFFAHTDITPWAQEFLQNISKDKKWKRVYLDDTIVIFTRI